MSKRISGKTDTEGDTLFYQITGNQFPLLMIPGGGGDGGTFLPLADALCEQYKVITYDRRANARSTVNYPNNFSIAQQCRDARAILNAAGEDSAFVLGNSSGAVIALELLTTFPNMVRKAVIHEPPMASLADDPQRWLAFFEDCYQTALKKGSGKAAAKFGMGVTGRMTLAPLFSDRRLKKFLKNEPPQFDVTRLPQSVADDIFIKQELLPITSYRPDVEALERCHDKLICAAGRWTVRKKVWFAEVSQKLADKTSCQFATLPGSHISFMDKPREWAAILTALYGGH